ncbi:SMI1/KNR4 family protein [Streptomyces sp. NPDC006798]|uniref:SMI1/KNR4 family protein n=1 Tax=Streptomyces sp. NPDC006798 TaxID=3155462 RepID=UPI0034104696
MTEHEGGDRSFPAALAALGGVDFAGHGIDFEMYGAFRSAPYTTEWLRDWTGNDDADGAAFRVFGRDGTGGQAALWLRRPGRVLVEQPVVFLGSEGECGVVAGCLSDFLWVLADGVGPVEAVSYDDPGVRADAGPAGPAGRFATTARRGAVEVIAGARAEFPSFADDVLALCR